MSAEDNEQLRTDIWDQIYRGGPQSVEQIAEDMQIDAGLVSTLTDHEWFANSENLISIAIDGQ